MDFTLSAEQELLRDTARSQLGRECPATLLRAHMDDPTVADELFDRHLRDWVALGDGDVVDLCLFAEEAGAVLLPGVHTTTTALFVPLLRAMAHPDADGAAAGAITGTVAVAGRDGRWRPNRDPVRTFVLEADRVDRIAVVIGPSAVAVLEADELTVRPVATLDTTRRTFEVDLPADLLAASPMGEELDAGVGARGALEGSAETQSGAVKAGGVLPVDADALDRVLRIATVTLAAELVGTARWLVDTTVAYARDRVQFDKPIGGFQAVQHQLVDAAFDLERATAAVAYAAMTIDADDSDQFRAAHVAKAAAGAAARHAAKVGLQVHGGIGYTWEHDLHLYLRRAYASDDLLGDVAWHHDRLAELLFD